MDEGLLFLSDYISSLAVNETSTGSLKSNG